MSKLAPVTVACGGGIGPESMDACLPVIKIAGAGIQTEVIGGDEKAYLSGNPDGLELNCRAPLRRTTGFYKVPVPSPPGGGFKRLNLSTRKRLGLSGYMLAQGQ